MCDQSELKFMEACRAGNLGLVMDLHGLGRFTRLLGNEALWLWLHDSHLPVADWLLTKLAEENPAELAISNPSDDWRKLTAQWKAGGLKEGAPKDARPTVQAPVAEACPAGHEMQTTVTEADDEELKGVVDSVTFAVPLASGKLEIAFTDPDFVSAEGWRDMADGKSNGVTFQGWNGDVSIRCEGGEVTFTVAKSGSGGDGTMTFSLPLPACRAALRHVAARVAEIHQKRPKA